MNEAFKLQGHCHAPRKQQTHLHARVSPAARRELEGGRTRVMAFPADVQS